MEENKVNGITEGTVWKQLLIFFFPILIGAFFQQLYNTVDAIILGQFAGKEALSSVGGSSEQIVSMMVGFFMGLSSGASVVIAQLFGGKMMEKLDRAVHTAYTFAAVGGLLVGIIGILSCPFFLKIMNTPQEIVASSMYYIRIYFSGLVFVFVYNMGTAILRAIGDSKRPLYYLIICSILNIFLDLLFVVIFRWSVVGVALATMIAQGVSAVLVTRTLMRRVDEFSLSFRKLGIDKEICLEMLRIGIPSGIQVSMFAVSNLIVQTALNQFGVDTLAAWTAFGKIDGVVWMVMRAFGISITTFAGQNYGAGKWSRIRKGVRTCLAMDIGFCMIFSVVIMMNGAFLFGIFGADFGVLEVGLRVMAIISPTYFVYSFVEILAGALRAEGHVVIPTAITIIGVCVFRIVWILFFVPNGSLEKLVYCYPTTWVFCAIAMTGYYLYKQNQIIKIKINESGKEKLC